MRRLSSSMHPHFVVATALSGLAGLSISFALSITSTLNWTVRMASDIIIFGHHLHFFIFYVLTYVVLSSSRWPPSQASDMEGNFVAVERIQQYSRIPGEAPRSTQSDETLALNWPVEGRIEFINAKLKYRPGLPLVLKGLNISIPAKSKVGVVGRTGELPPGILRHFHSNTLERALKHLCHSTHFSFY